MYYKYRNDIVPETKQKTKRRWLDSDYFFLTFLFDLLRGLLEPANAADR